MSSTKEANAPALNLRQTFRGIPRSKHKMPSADRADIKRLLEMHSFKRPMNSAAEREFRDIYINHIPGMMKDACGNRYVVVGESPTVLWSSHTDTVHHISGRQKLTYANGFLYLREDEKANCLGADCTAGVWLMLEMIEKKIPGLYIFHHGEERGGIGSGYIRDKTPELLAGIKYAIAFDRRGTDSVITSQFGGVCASSTFAHALADALGGEFAPDPGGSFTDTANYKYLVPECTNLSVGYYNAHCNTECLDVGFLANLLEKICALDVNLLPAVRDHTVRPTYSSYRGGKDWDGETYGSYSSANWKNKVWDSKKGVYVDKDDLLLLASGDTSAEGNGSGVGNNADNRNGNDSGSGGNGSAFLEADLLTLVQTYPSVAKEILEQLGITADDFWQQIVPS